MECFYINLDTETNRRNALEDNFNHFRTENWNLTRFPAVTADDVVRERIGGRIRSAEKACFLSHRQVIADAARLNCDALVTEDDALFGPSTFAALDAILRDPSSNEWDIIFTDVGVPDVSTQYQLVKLKQDFQNHGQYKVIDLHFFPSFFGTTSYVMKAGGSEKMLSHFSEDEILNLPYDIFMRKYIHENKIKAGVVFPFLTSIADNSLVSNIQPSTHEIADIAWMLFRRMIWVDGNYENCGKTLKCLDDLANEESKAYGKIWSVIADKKFLSK